MSDLTVDACAENEIAVDLSEPPLVESYPHKYRSVKTTFSSIQKHLFGILSFCPLAKVFIYLSVFDMLVFFLIALFNVGIFFRQCNGLECTSDSRIFGLIIGTLMQWNIFLLFLPVTRNGIFSLMFGISYDKLIFFHKWIGRWVFILMVIHMIVFLFAFRTGWPTVRIEFSFRDNINGEISGAFLVIIVLTSLKWVRTKFYEIFMKAHWLFFPLFIIFAELHKNTLYFSSLLVIPLMLYGIDFFVRLWFVTLSGCTPTWSRLGNGFIQLELSHFDRYRPGQWVYLYIPQVSWFQIHPFSVASAPEIGRHSMKLLIGVNGNWTRKLDRIIKEDPQKITRVWVDGGYGHLSIAPPQKYKQVVFVAGGAGIGAMVSLLRSLESVHEHQMPKIVLVWACRSMDLIVAMHQDLIELKQMFGPNLTLELYHSNRSMDLELTQLEDLVSSSLWNQVRHSRPDFKQLFSSVREKACEIGTSTVGVYVCGSASVSKAVLKVTNSYLTFGTMFHVHTENFAF